MEKFLMGYPPINLDGSAGCKSPSARTIDMKNQTGKPVVVFNDTAKIETLVVDGVASLFYGNHWIGVGNGFGGDENGVFVCHRGICRYNRHSEIVHQTVLITEHISFFGFYLLQLFSVADNQFVTVLRVEFPLNGRTFGKHQVGVVGDGFAF
jgi:hypothetical protein